MEELTLRKLIEWAMKGGYDLDKPMRFCVEWTDYMKDTLPKEGLLYMPMVGMRQYDWGIVFEMGEKE